MQFQAKPIKNHGNPCQINQKLCKSKPHPSKTTENHANPAQNKALRSTVSPSKKFEIHAKSNPPTSLERRACGNKQRLTIDQPRANRTRIRVLFRLTKRFLMILMFFHRKYCFLLYGFWCISVGILVFCMYSGLEWENRNFEKKHENQ